MEHAGDYDIYQSTLSFDGVWSQPVAVKHINTSVSEVFPTLLQDRRLPSLAARTITDCSCTP